jgi:hypothetical protein
MLGVVDGAESDLRAPSASPGLYRAPFFDSPFLALPGAHGADAMLDLQLPVVGSGGDTAQPQGGAMPLHSAAVAPAVLTAPAAHPMTMDLQPDDVLLAPFLPEDEAYMDQVGEMFDSIACCHTRHQLLSQQISVDLLDDLEGILGRCCACDTWCYCAVAGRHAAGHTIRWISARRVQRRCRRRGL